MPGSRVKMRWEIWAIKISMLGFRRVLFPLECDAVWLHVELMLLDGSSLVSSQNKAHNNRRHADAAASDCGDNMPRVFIDGNRLMSS
jgi:hypothetical protein